jgi:predicted ATP-grasp superfamily ATP-dependent carboligase
MKVLVTDGDERPALAITRALGRRGVTVLVGDERPACLAASSRYAAGQVVYPSPYRAPQAFQRFLAELVAHAKVDAVMPVCDVTTTLTCAMQDRLRRHTALAVPPLFAFDRMTDKSAALRAAAACGIPIPRTEFVSGLSGLAAAAGRVAYPAVVKSSRSRIATAQGWVGTTVQYVSDEADLRRVYERTAYLQTHPSLIQARVDGPGTGLFVLFDRGELLTAFAHRRLREKPPSGGVSVLCESVPVDPVLRAGARRLLAPLRWHGVAMLEYKEDRRTGELLLLEVNGRFWGSLELAVHAGVDFPYLTFQLARGERPQVPESYRVGLQNRWLLGDLDHLLLRLRRQPCGAGLPAGARSRLEALADFLGSTAARVHDQVASGDDPAPFRYELRRYLRTCFAAA